MTSATLAKLWQLPGMKRSNPSSSNTAIPLQASVDSRPTFNSQNSFPTYPSNDIDLSFESLTDDSMSYTAPAQTDKWGWAKATNKDDIINPASFSRGFLSLEELSRQPSMDTGFRRTDTKGRLSELRKLMRNEKIDY
ncbi:hypothetical protein BDV93DRAFT_561342 [Ceratobasidium sp. AG-I]|nr:hypothetical protein BDV93DRAFT_561342 [Ceratobasidium sp. AG-I]